MAFAFFTQLTGRSSSGTDAGGSFGHNHNREEPVRPIQASRSLAFMKFTRLAAVAALAAILALAVPVRAVWADGAASTRNILIGVGAAAATLVIINHNRKVHEKYAEDAQRQAALQQANHNAWAAYSQERRAYQQEVAVNAELKKELSYQHAVVEQQRRKLAASNAHPAFAAATPVNGEVVSYGWGDL
jgi:hypothetical protein